MTIEQHLRKCFPELSDTALFRQIVQQGKFYQAREGEVVLDVGQYIRYLPLLVEGTIKIMRNDEEGREVFLYYLQPGDACAVALSCCMKYEKSGIRAVAEEDAAFIMLPALLMDEWMLKFSSWRNFVMNTYSKRFNELLHTIDSIAFMKMDERLWNYLLDKAYALNSSHIHTTHQRIATELNSTREVISRLLKQLEKQGQIRLERNQITLLHYAPAGEADSDGKMNGSSKLI